MKFCPAAPPCRHGNIVYLVKCSDQSVRFFSGAVTGGSQGAISSTKPRPRLFAFMEELTAGLRRQNRAGTAANYRAALMSFRRFRASDISLDLIDRALIEEYQSYLLSGGLSLNSVSFYMRILRAVYNRAVEQGMVADRRPFATVFTGMEKTRKRAISAVEIRRIHTLNLSSRPDLEFARDIFIFLFFCRGMSFIDAAFLRKSDVSNGVIIYRRHKTGQRLEVKIISQIAEIIARYPVAGSPYLLPVIMHPGRDERRQYETALRRVNDALKTVGAMAAVTVPLTTYVSRHSWATIAKRKNIPVAVISDALGHESVSTTQIYLDSIDTSVIDRANDIVVKGI